VYPSFLSSLDSEGFSLSLCFFLSSSSLLRVVYTTGEWISHTVLPHPDPLRPLVSDSRCIMRACKMVFIHLFLCPPRLRRPRSPGWRMRLMRVGRPSCDGTRRVYTLLTVTTVDSVGVVVVVLVLSCSIASSARRVILLRSAVAHDPSNDAQTAPSRKPKGFTSAEDAVNETAVVSSIRYLLSTACRHQSVSPVGHV